MPLVKAYLRWFGAARAVTQREIVLAVMIGPCATDAPPGNIAHLLTSFVNLLSTIDRGQPNAETLLLHTFAATDRVMRTAARGITEARTEEIAWRTLRASTLSEPSVRSFFAAIPPAPERETTRRRRKV